MSELQNKFKLEIKHGIISHSLVINFQYANKIWYRHTRS